MRTELDHFHPDDLKALYYKTEAARQAIVDELKDTEAKTRLYDRLYRERRKKDRLLLKLEEKINLPTPQSHANH